MQPVTLKFDFRSDLAETRAVQQQIMQAVHDHGFDDDSIFGIKLSLEEALVNAVKHGNKLDPAKSVHVLAKVSEKQVEITIEDEGPGFDRHKVPDPTADENLTKCSGRGLLLMEAYMTKVEYSNKGRTIRLVKKKA